MSLAWKGELLVVAPKVTQAVFAALGDYYTWRLARKVYGRESYQALSALALTVLSPWQWFCSTRTLSNCLETTLTIAALNYWPWQWSIAPTENDRENENLLRKEDTDDEENLSEVSKLRICLLLAALACVLRPTNLLIWLCLTCLTVLQPTAEASIIPVRWADKLFGIQIQASSIGFGHATRRERIVLFREAVLCGSLILALEAMVDYAYYGFWTFPPLRFLYFNVAQSLSVVYGRNDWHYYLSQGYPLLLTTFLPFALIGLYQALFSQTAAVQSFGPQVSYQLALTAIIVPTILSLVSHKEVRFIYPLLPALHLLASRPFANFFSPILDSSRSGFSISSLQRRLRASALTVLLAINITIALYLTTTHASGVIGVMSQLRNHHERTSISEPPPSTSLHPTPPESMTVAFLMPCHSTPWRSHLVHPSIHAWALGCEPPVNLNVTARAAYVDEADRFYADPASWLRKELGRPPHSHRALSNISPNFLERNPRPSWSFESEQKARVHGTKEWPEYLVFFEQLEQTMSVVLRGSGYGECWRTFNTAWHDDSRRKGDVIVWCLHDDEKKAWARKPKARTSKDVVVEKASRLLNTKQKKVEGRQDGWLPWTKKKAKKSFW